MNLIELLLQYLPEKLPLSCWKQYYFELLLQRLKCFKKPLSSLRFFYSISIPVPEYFTFIVPLLQYACFVGKVGIAKLK